MKARKMVCADRFYPSGARCQAELEDMFANTGDIELSARVLAGIVPHAGWVFSGQLAAEVFEAVAISNPNVETFVLFGASHSYMVENPVVYEDGSWETPIGNVEVDADLAQSLKEAIPELETEKFLHDAEHSIEVNVPFIKYRFPQATILPILMPPSADALNMANDIAKHIASQSEGRIVCIGSSDLTHYGSDYGFTPAGTGPIGCKWAKDVNDKAVISAILQMDYKLAFETAIKDCSACGPAAIAAAICTARELGANNPRLLSHTHSRDVMQEKFARPSSSSVGYAAIIFTE